VDAGQVGLIRRVGHERLGERRNDCLRRSGQLAPCDTEHSVPARQQLAVAAAVALERGAPAVKAKAVAFDDEPLRRPRRPTSRGASRPR